MPRRSPLRLLVLGSALAAPLLLTPHGVRVTHAAEGHAEETATDGGICRVEDPVASAARRVELQALLRSRLAEEARRGSGSDVVVLNGRGYNYGGDPSIPDPLLLRFEAIARGGGSE